MNTRTDFDRVFAIAPGGRGVVVGILVAAAAHGVLGVAMARRATAAEPPVPPPIELDLALPREDPLPEPPAPEETKPEETKPEEVKVAPVAIKAAAPARPPPAAKVGALLTAQPDAQKTEEPVSFLSDATGGTYGSGVVAHGGTAEVGVKGAQPITAPPAPAVTIDKTPLVKVPVTDVPVTNLSRKPSLPAGDACKGFFPGSADDDVAVVTVRVVVRPNGDVASVVVTNEDPRGQGFGQAARSCLSKSRFVPGLDVEGKPVTAQSLVNVRFSR